MLSELATVFIASATTSASAHYDTMRRARWVPGQSFVEGSNLVFGSVNGKPQVWVAHNCNQPHACQLSADGGILRMELRVHDHWEGDVEKKAGVERTMIQAVPNIGSPISAALPLATDIWRAFSFLLEPGPAITATGPGYDWLILADIHSNYAASHATAVPIQFELSPGDYFTVRTHGTVLHMTPPDSGGLVYRSPGSIARGRWHDVVMRVNMDPRNITGRGGADVFLDGQQVLAYTGPLGFDNDLPYHQFQIYRPDPGTAASGNETIAIQFANSESLTWSSLAPRAARPFCYPRLPARA